MSDIYVGELQDEDGNTVYPHTEADVCFCTDGKNVQEKINNELLSNTKVLKTIEEIEANTNVENIAGATALKEVNNKLMSITDNDQIKSIDVREDGVYITYVPADGADPVSKKLGSPDPDAQRFISYYVNSGSSNTFYLADGVYIYTKICGGNGNISVSGSIYENNVQTSSIEFRYCKYGIATTDKSNVVTISAGANAQSATILLYKISD